MPAARSPRLFEHEGEAAFREREAEALASLVAEGRSVIATGGGAVLRPENRELLRTRTVCVFLDASHDLLWKRLRRDRRRPLLQVADPEARLRELSAERDPLYRETAHIVVDADGLSFDRLVDEVVRRICRRERGDERDDSRRHCVRVQLGDRSYSIAVGSNLLGATASYQELPRGSSAIIVSNETVAPLYGDRLAAALAALYPQGRRRLAAGRRGPQGPGRRCRPSSTRMLAAHCDRSTTVFALGGGVVGDLAGFAAACYMRGVAYVQVPTTLLAQVDSSVGGKTGVNHPSGKNMIGAFHQPLAVIADVDVLDTLPDRELVAGLAEVIKYGAVADDAFLGWIEASLPALLARDKAVAGAGGDALLPHQGTVVAGDEREAGCAPSSTSATPSRHAIETGTGHGTWLHGEAVGCGMAMAADLSARLGLIAPAHAARIARIVARGRPAVARADARRRALCRADAHGQESRSRPDPFHRARRARQGGCPGGRRVGRRGDDRGVRRLRSPRL